MSKASKVRSLRLAVVAAAVLGVTPAWAQGNDPQQPQQGPANPTGPAGTPVAGPSLTVSSDGTTQAGTPAAPEQDTPSPQTLKLPPKKAEGGPKPLIWAGSVFFANQSINTEAVGVGKDYQSRNPSYQLWFSVRPRFALYNGDRDKVSATTRLDITKELTNGEDTTQYRETTLGDAWLTVNYSHTFVKKNGWSTSLSTGPRALFPTSKNSRANGAYVTLGGGAGLLQMIPLNRGSEWFSSARVLGSAYYTHAFTQATTPTFPDSAIAAKNPRTSADSPFQANATNQMAGNLLAEHQVLSVIDTGLQITPKLGLTVDTIFIQRWAYRPKEQMTPLDLPTGRTMVGPGVNASDPQNYRLSIYFLASVDYQLSDELNLSFDYYSFANTIGADGQRQSMFYSPEAARFSMTATVGLDALYERIRGTDAAGGGAGQGGRVAKGAAPVLSF